MVFPLGFSVPTYNVDQVPEPFHEYFIVTGYRHPKSTAIQCILSVFDATNETLNFWTHFLPSFYFLWVLYALLQSLDFWNDPYTWPLLVYLTVCCILPMTSAIAHTFNTMSVHARHICFFLDYGALSLFSLGVAIAYRAYIFPKFFQDTLYADIFLIGAIFNAISCTIAACLTRFMKRSYSRTLLRLTALAIPYMYVAVPVLGRLFFCSPEECQMPSQHLHGRQLVFAAVAVFFFATRIPERLNPGKFDIIGHSHQLFHIGTAIGLMDQVAGVTIDFQERKWLLKDDQVFSSAINSIGVMSSVFIINALIILFFSFKLIRSTRKMA